MAERLILLTGPSCAGKSPLWKALQEEFPETVEEIGVPVPYTSRPPRPGETDGQDYHFRTRTEIEELSGDGRFLVTEVRDDVQALDLRELEEELAHHDMLYEGNVRLAGALLQRERGLARRPVLSVFLSPLSREEVEALRESQDSLQRVVTELMRRRLLRRALGKTAILSIPELEDVEVRARSSFEDLCRAHEFEHVLPCHDGEDSDHWSAFPCTLGDARRAVRALADLLRDGSSPLMERWPEALLGV